MKHQKELEEKLLAQADKKLKEKQADLDKLNQEHQPLQAAFEQKKTLLKQARATIIGREVALQRRTMLFEEQILKVREKARDEKQRMSKELQTATKTYRKNLKETRTKFNLEQHKYEVQAQSAIGTIKKLKQEWQEARAKEEMGVKQIKEIVRTLKSRLERRIEKRLVKGWREWLTQATELQRFWADQENQLKAGKGFYKMH